MLSITKFLCRLWRGAVPSEGGSPRETTADETEGLDESPTDDLTVIRGIGIATQDRLYRAGIKSFSQLAKASPEKVREVLGISARGAKVESWIKEAAGLVK